MATVHFDYKSDVVHAGGGKRYPERKTRGQVEVMADGSLSIEPDDDYYCGDLTREESVLVAHAIIVRLPESVLARAFPPDLLRAIMQTRKEPAR